MKILTRIIQLLLIVAPIVLLGWLATQWFVPSGVFFASHTVGQDSPFIDEIQPSQRTGDVRMNEQGFWEQPIVADPTFFFVHPHRDFERVDVEVWFENTSVPIIEFGGMIQDNPEVTTLYPLHNKIIDDSVWNRIDKEGMVLLQREATYNSLDAFFADPPRRNEVATYQTSFDVPYRIAGYMPTDTIQTIDASLRGHHELKTYIKDETMLFEFDYMDMNRDEGEDLLSVVVFNEAGLPVAEARAEDDGNFGDDAMPTGLEHLTLSVPGLIEGVYKLVINTTNDVFIRRIQTPQQKMVFLDTVYLGDEVGFAEPAVGATFWTKAEVMRVQTRHAEGVQTMTVNNSNLEVEEPYVWYSQPLNSGGLSIVDAPAGDVEVVLEGGIAFSADQYFDPDPVKLTYMSDLDELGVDYVIANYESPREVDGWFVKTLSFNTAELFAEEDGTWKFVFSTPGIDDLNVEFIAHKINTWMYRDELIIK